MIGIYFSGTGNTKYCIEKFLNFYGQGNTALSIEDDEAVERILEHDRMILAYPCYFSNIPKIVRDFIVNNQELFKDKQVFIIVTMGLFSGDGAGCAARILKKCGAKVIGSVHIKMPDCVGDVKLLKKSVARNRELVRNATRKLQRAANRLKTGRRIKTGLTPFSRVMGFICQRLWTYGNTLRYSDKLKINAVKCTGCGACALLCPMKNLHVEGKTCVSNGACTMCYRCISHCPQKAITLCGKEVVEQCCIEKYM